MSELVVAALKIAFLALLWVFILFAANIIRSDLFGRSVATSEAAPFEPLPARQRPSRAQRKAARNLPTSLTVTQGRTPGVSIPLAGIVGLGRAADSALNIDDDYASTRHAQLIQDDQGAWWLEDLASTNGTSLNATPIHEPTRVQAGDTIRIGRTIMRLDK